MTATQAGTGDAAQVLRLAADTLAELALEEHEDETALSLTQLARDRLWERIREDGQLKQRLPEWSRAQRGAFALVAVAMTELVQCLSGE